MYSTVLFMDEPTQEIQTVPGSFTDNPARMGFAPCGQARETLWALVHCCPGAPLGDSRVVPFRYQPRRTGERCPQTGFILPALERKRSPHNLGVLAFCNRWVGPMTLVFPSLECENGLLILSRIENLKNNNKIKKQNRTSDIKLGKTTL